MEFANLPPKPAPSVSKLSASRPSGLSPRLPDLFQPGTLLSFRLQGFTPSRESATVSSPFLPCRFCAPGFLAQRTCDFGGFTPLESSSCLQSFPRAGEPIPS